MLPFLHIFRRRTLKTLSRSMGSKDAEIMEGATATPFFTGSAQGWDWHKISYDKDVEKYERLPDLTI